MIPCLNEMPYIEALFDALDTQERQADEIIVADAGSTDGSAIVAEQYSLTRPYLSLKVLYVATATIPAVLNAAIREAQGDIIIRLDGHSRPQPDYIRRLVDTLEEAPDGLVGGVWRILPGSQSIMATAIARAVSHPLGAGGAAYRIAQREVGRFATDTVPFGCFRKAVWERLGGFNERLLTNEDYEFNYRVRRSGGSVILDTGVTCAYVARSTLGALAQQYFRYGWWKAQMLKGNAASLRVRQAVPVAFVALMLALIVAIPFTLVAAPLLASLGLAYALGLSAVAGHVAFRCRDWRLAPGIAAAFATVHFTWGIGALVNLATAGYWPTWSAPAIAQPAPPLMDRQAG